MEKGAAWRPDAAEDDWKGKDMKAPAKVMVAGAGALALTNLGSGTGLLGGATEERAPSGTWCLLSIVRPETPAKQSCGVFVAFRHHRVV